MYSTCDSCFRLYGDLESQLKKTQSDYEKQYGDGIRFEFCEKHADDYLVKIGSKYASSPFLDECIKSFITEYKKNIYSTYDVEAVDMLISLLKLGRLMLSSAESFTGGSIAREIVNVAGASEVFFEGLVCYNAQAKINRLGVNRRVIEQFGVVSAETACEMVVKLLENSNCDIAVATTGYASPTSEPDSQNGLCFIAVGYLGRINCCKFNFSGDRKEIIEKGKNAAIYMLIKALKP